MATTWETRTKTFDEATLAARRAAFREAERKRRLKYPSAWIDPNYYADPTNSSAASWLTSVAASSPYTEAIWYRQQIAAMASMLGDEQEAALNQYMDRGVVSPGVAAGLASAAKSIALDEDTLNAIATLDATYRTMEAAQTNPMPGSEGEKGKLARFFGTITRPAFALLSMPFETVYGTLRNIAGGVMDSGVGGAVEGISNPEVDPWEQSLGGQFIRGLIDPNYSADLGEGWFPAGAVHARQVQAAREAAPLVHGRAWTPGRGFASLFIEDPDSRTYRNVSGFIDLVANVVLDPTVLLGAGGAGIKAAQVGGRAAQAVKIGEVGQAAAAEKALATAEAWLAPRDVIEAAASHVRRATASFSEVQRKNGQGLAAQRLATANDRYAQVTDRIALARSDAALPGREQLTDVEISERVRNATENLPGDDLGSLAARVSAEAPDLPGTFTREKPANASSIIGTHDGVDAIVTVIPDNPSLVSVDELIDLGALRTNIGKLDAPKQARQRALATVDEAVAKKKNNKQPDTLEMVLDQATRDRTGGTIAAALRVQGIDGVTDMFRLTGREGGVWWIGPNVDVVRRGASGAWEHLDVSAEAARMRLQALGAEQRSAASQRGKATQDANIHARAAKEHADQFDAVMNGKLDLTDVPTTVQTAVRYALGVRQKLGGKPEVDHEALKSFLLGQWTDFDAATVSILKPSHKAVLAADRALMGAYTLGTSEIIRAAKKLGVDPLMARARARILSDMVRLSDTPENLGRLHRLTGAKMDPQSLRAALQATDEDQVLEALAPHLGVQITRPITPGALSLARSRFAEVRTGRTNDHLFRRGVRWIIDEAERLGTIAPRGLVTLNFADPMGSARDFRNYLDNIPDLDTRVTDDIMGRYLRANNETGRARAVMDGFDEVFDAVSAHNATLGGWSEETQQALRRALKDATQVYDAGRAEVNTWWSRRYALDAKSSVISANGEVIPLPGPQLEAELARGGVVLPNMANLRDSMGRWGAFLESRFARKGKGISAESIRDVVSAGNDFWRSAVLFRPAYVLRNIGEMQSRMFLFGHSSIFSHPLGLAAFAVASTSKHPKLVALAERFTKANKTATGHTMTAVGIDDVRGLDEARDLFADSILAKGSRLDMRTHRAMEAFHGLEEVSVGKPGFLLGFAEQLLTMRSSRLARVLAGNHPDEVATAIERGASREDAIVNWLLSSKLAHPIRQLFADNDYAYSRIFGNPRLGVPGDPVALRQFLFTAEGSVQKRIDYYVRGQDELRDFIATGTLNRDGKELFTMAVDVADAEAYSQAMALRGRRLSQQLRPFVDRFDPDTKLFMRVLRHRGGEKPFQVFDRTFDWFFDWAGKMENAWAVGPEFAYAYHQKLAQLLPAVRRSTPQGKGKTATTRYDRQQVFDTIKAAEGKLRFLSETMTTARIGLKHADAGMLTVEDVSAMAAKYASEHVKTFFYDAMRRQQFFHAARVVWPFAQSFVDTLHRWGSLVAARPYVMEKVGRLGMGLQEEGSNIIYDDFDYIDPITNRQSHDPTQGFLWNDPQTGEQMFSFPLIGSVLGAIFSPVAGVMTGENIDLASAMQLSAPLRNLNIALQGDVDYLPGAGPIITFPMNLIFPEDAFGSAPEWLRAYLFPYGRLRFEEGILEAGVFPTWLRRLTGAFYNDEFRNYAVKGSMAYLMSTREYPEFRSNPIVAQQFMDDTGTMASFMTVIRAFGAFVLPAAPTQEIYAADKDGSLIATLYISDRWHHLLESTGNDTEAATAALADTYGLSTLAAIAGPASEAPGGDVPFSAGAWEFFKANPKRGEAFADVLGYFFPGDFSYESNQWVRETARRRSLSVQERTDNLTEFLYFAERRMLEGRAAQEGWDTGAIRAAEDELDAMYANVIPSFEVGNIDRELAKIRRALDRFPELAATRAGEGAGLLFESYDTHVEEAAQRFGAGATLKSERATALRESFLTEVDQILSQYGGYNLATGSVDTIAGMFARLVEPEE